VYYASSAVSAWIAVRFTLSKTKQPGRCAAAGMPGNAAGIPLIDIILAIRASLKTADVMVRQPDGKLLA
jgi:hypothetical protein